MSEDIKRGETPQTAETPLDEQALEAAAGGLDVLHNPEVFIRMYGIEAYKSLFHKEQA